MKYALHSVMLMLVISALWSVGNGLSPRGNDSAVIYCAHPGTPLNGQRGDRLNSFPPGITVKYYCDFTFQLVGPQNRTCLADGSWSSELPLCKKYMCDELDAWPPKNGKRIAVAFTIGSEVKFRCSSLYTLIGQDVLTCLPNGQWSSKPPTCEHRCKQVRCDGGMICKMRNLKPTCVCRTNMECSSLWSPVCGSDGETYNNECIMKATACRMNKNIRVITRNKCLPGDRCSIVPSSYCRAAFRVYFYNSDVNKCQRMIAGGCHPSGWNGFFVKEDCKNYCEKETCALKPDRGPCDLKITRWYYNAHTRSCETFEYGGCFGNSNNYRTLEDCKTSCAKKI
mgnify:CR=1 FL=1